MSTYNHGGYVRIGLGDGSPDLATLMAVADQFTEALRVEYPGHIERGQVIQRELALSAEDGLPPNLGRIRSSLDAVAIVAGAGTRSLTCVQQLAHALSV
ncbi:hypothetical protein [Streptomyces sp. MMG1121]|uniref:hypothetical protein n=1 Tax=Streptomyces sp. MMG1121 TaxID=1415544 RepID=UPI0006AE757A|nr:hypothetical protein [Streptomyces sp. MMG1121]KOV69298.1 hypothetical protein ADK64_06275 [Streptomyces sp. MMG1121]